jgi:predicted metal-binding protein
MTPDRAAPVELIVCETCGSAERETHGSTRGERFLALLREHAASTPAVSVSSTRCLWSCSRSCAVHMRGEGRVSYVLASFEPDADAALALLEYATLYAASSDGAVPFRQWPQGVRGHFVCRLPVLADAGDDALEPV